MKKNVSGQKIGVQMASATDGSAFTSTVTVYVTLDAGTQAIGTVGSGICTHEGNGYHTYAPSQAETNGDLVAFTFIGTGAIPATVQIFTTFPQTGDNFALIGTTGSGLTSLAPASTALSTAQWTSARAGYLDNINNATLAGATFPATVASTTNITAGTITTATNVTTVNGLAAGVITAASIAADAITDAKVASDVTIASVTGSVGSVTGNVGGNVVGSVGSVTGLTASNLDATISSRMATYTQPTGFLAATFPTTVASTTNITAATGCVLSNAGVDAIWDEALSGHLTAGSVGYALNAAGSAGDPWSIVLPGSYASGTAGHTVGQLTFTVANQLDVNMLSQAGSTVYTKDFTLSAYSANVITLPSTYADSSSLPDDDRYADCIISIIGGTGKGTFLRTTTAAAGARAYNIDAPIVAPDNTSQCIVVQCLRLAPITTNWLTATGLATTAVDEIADAVWDEATSGHTTVGSTGEALTAEVAVDITEEDIAAIAAEVLAGIAGGNITVSSPIVDDGGNFEITQGDAYLNSDGNAVSWTIGATPDLTGATVALRIQGPGSSVTSITCTVTNAGTSAQLIKADITATQSASFDPGNYAYDLQAVLSSSSPRTLVAGAGMNVKAQVE